MGTVISFLDYQPAADRWLQGDFKRRLANDAQEVALTLYESSVGFVDTAPSEWNCDSGDESA